MKSFLKLLLVPLVLLAAACKKDNTGYQSLNITGLGSVAFASGDAVSIYGSGFDTIPGNNIVTFNGVAGEVATATPNRLQVIVPLLISNGTISVKTHGMQATASQSYTVVNVLQGAYTNSLTLTADKKYLLRGNVTFGSKLIIEPGTVIYGEKLTHGSLVANNIDFEGTAAQPVIFTSDQAPGSRQPGDWGGITGNYTGIPLGIMEYVRVEFAGYHLPGSSGQAIKVQVDQASVFKYIQVTSSAGDGIVLAQGGNNSYIEHIVALGCGGNDFSFQSGGVTTQYGLAIKDPYYADPLQGNGIAVTNVGGVTLSNFTLIGYNPAARNIVNPAGVPLTQNAGRGITVGGGDVYIYNSVIAGSWIAGASLAGGAVLVNQNTPTQTVGIWYSYEDSVAALNTLDISFRYNYLTGTAPAAIPYRGGSFDRENFISPDGVEDISGTPQLAVFGMYNDTTRLLDLTQGKDDLGLRGLADYQQMTHPSVLPAAGSPLLKGALFPALTPANTPQLNKEVTYVGAFGTEDWTAGWTNFNPQQTSY